MAHLPGHTAEFHQRGRDIRCTLTTPDGRVYTAVVDMHPDNPELGFGGRFKRAMKKAVTKPIKAVHKVTHSGPIEAMHKKVQETVGKYIPIAKPFISIHNSLAKPVHKLIEGKKHKQTVTAKAIADVTKHLPTAQKKVVIPELVRKAKVAEQVKDAAKLAALAKAAKIAIADKGKASVKGAAAAKAGFYVVTRPDGKVINVPASKVA